MSTFTSSSSSSSSPPLSSSGGFAMTPREMRPTTSSVLNAEVRNVHRKRQNVSCYSPFNKQSQATSLSISIPAFTEKESQHFLRPPLLPSGSLSPAYWSAPYSSFSPHSDTSRESMFSPHSSLSSSLSRTLSSHSNDSDSSGDNRSSCLSPSSFDSSSAACSRKHARSDEDSFSSSSSSSDDTDLSQHQQQKTVCAPGRPVAHRHRNMHRHRHRHRQTNEDEGRASVTSMLSEDMLLRWSLDSPSSSKEKKRQALFSPDDGRPKARNTREGVATLCDNTHRDQLMNSGDDAPMSNTPHASTTPHQSHHHRFPAGFSFSFSGEACSLFSPSSSSSDLSPSPPLLHTVAATPTQPLLPTAATTTTTTIGPFLQSPAPSFPVPTAGRRGRALARHETEPTVVLTPLPQATPTRGPQHSTGDSGKSRRQQQGGGGAGSHASNLFSTPQGVKHRSSHHICGGGDDDWADSEAALGLELDQFSQLLRNESSKRCPQISVTLSRRREESLLLAPLLPQLLLTSN